MIRINLNCDCCEVYVIPSHRRGAAYTYVLNGKRFLGLTELGDWLGISNSTAGARIKEKRCLRLSAAEVNRQQFEMYVRPGKKIKDEGPSRELAKQFCRVMAASFSASGGAQGTPQVRG